MLGKNIILQFWLVALMLAEAEYGTVSQKQLKVHNNFITLLSVLHFLKQNSESVI